METERFDELTKAMGGRSRRRLLGGIAAALGLSALFLADEAEAGKRKRRRRRRKKKDKSTGITCKPAESLCGGKHCCAPGQQCLGQKFGCVNGSLQVEDACDPDIPLACASGECGCHDDDCYCRIEECAPLGVSCLYDSHCCSGACLGASHCVEDIP